MRRVLAIALVLAAPLLARAQAFEGTGQARIVNENRVAARARALDEAMRQAVERAVDGLLGPDMRATRPGEVRAVAARAKSLIERYSVLAERDAGGLYEVQIEATVDAQRLGAALGHAAAPRPATAGPAVVLRLEGGGDAEPLRRALAQAGVAVSMTTGREVRVTRVITDEGEVRGADVWAAKAGLTAAVQGTAPVSVTARRFAPTLKAARAEAEQAAAAELAPGLARAVAPAESGGLPVRLVGRFGYRHYRAFSQALAAAQVGAVEPRRFGQRFVQLWVATSLAPADLGRRVTQLPLPGLQRVVERADPGEVRVRLEVTDAEAPEGLP
jgi:hypothetical protein